MITHETIGFEDYLRALVLDARLGQMTPLCTAQRSWPLDPAQVDLDGVWTTLTGHLLAGGREDRFELLFHSVSGETRVALAAGPAGQVLHLEASRYEALATAYSTATEECQRLLARVESCLPAADASGAEVSMDFWFHGSRGAECINRRIRCPGWPEISRNYPVVRKELEPLMALGRPWERGRLIFWHGPPGTGKTHAIRALLREWPAARGAVITDPERLFDDAAYLHEVVLSGGDLRRTGRRRQKTAGPSDSSFQLLLLEDAPDLVLRESRASKWHLMSKLLNLSDGLIGQGLQIVILITTNEEVERIDPAFTRPGRAIQVLRFEPFGADEAAAWLAERGRPEGPPDARDTWTLAELYAILAGTLAPAEDRAARMGFAHRKGGRA